MRKKKKVIIIFLVFIILAIVIGVLVTSKHNTKISTNKVKLSDKVKALKKEELEDELIENNEVSETTEKTTTGEEKVKTESKIQSNNNSSSSQAKSSSSSTKSTNESSSNNSSPSSSGSSSNQGQTNNQGQSSNILNPNEVSKTNMDYVVHKGRIDCNDSSTCTSNAMNFYIRYKTVIANFYIVDVISNGGNTLGYFIEYVFKDGSYDNIDNCNSIGNEIKSQLSDRVTNYQCNLDGSKYSLKIFTDYD